MPSWRVLRTSEKWLTASDLYSLKGERFVEIDAEIVRVEQGEANNPGSDKTKKLPAVFLRSLKNGQELPKPLGLNATNGLTIENLAGTDDYKRWPGVRVTLFVIPDARFGREKRPAIRIRPTSPAAPATGATSSQPQQGRPPATNAQPPGDEMTPEEQAEIARREAKGNG